MNGDEIAEGLARDLLVLRNRVYRVQVLGLLARFCFFQRNRFMSAQSDAIDAVTAKLVEITTQYPPLVAAAIAAGSTVDPALAGSIGNLTTASGNLVTALQGTLPSTDPAL